MTIQYSVAANNARLDAIETTIGASAILKIRTGAVPANAAAADTGTVLATVSLPADWMSGAANASDDWESWVEPEEKVIEHGILPVELKQQAERAVTQAMNATSEKDEGKLVLRAMEALRSFEEAYKTAYKEVYNQEVVYRIYRTEVLREKRNRAIALLLLH